MPFDALLTWPKRSLAVLEAVLLERSLRCPDCNTREDEWGRYEQDGEGRRVLRPHSQPPYEAITHECPGCKAIEMRASREKGALPPGVKVGLGRRRKAG